MAGEWNRLRFSEAVVLNPGASLLRGKTYPFVSMQAIEPAARSVGPDEFREFSGGGSRFETGDTLMARITPCLENGKIARFCADSEHAVGHGSTEFIVIRGREGVTDNDFAYYLTKSEEVRGFAISQMTGTSGRQRVPTDALAALEVLAPPLSEQRAIAHILGTLDDKIELNRRMNETLEEMARALFTSWFVDFDPVRAKAEGRQSAGMDAATAGLFPRSFENGEQGSIPSGWRKGSVAEIAIEQRRQVEPKQVEIGTPYIGLEHMPRRSISLADWGDADALESAKFRFETGDILFGKLRPYFHKVGVAVVDGVCSTDIVVMTPRADIWFSILLCVVSSEDFVGYTDSASTGTRMPRTNWRDMARYQLALPPDPLADAFDAKVRPLVQRIRSNILENQSLSAIREALLPKLLSGAIRVSEAEKLVEALI